MKSLILRDHEVRRLLDVGSVTVVRAVKLHPDARPNSAFPARDGMPVFLSGFKHDTPEVLRKLSLSYANGIPCPIGAPGEQRWVRETWAWPGEEQVIFRADPWTKGLERLAESNPNYPQIRWHSPVALPRRASRAVVEVASVRVARVKDLTVDDIEATGLILDLKRHTTPLGGESGTGRYINSKGQPSFSTVDGCFASAWNEQRGATKCANDPWVWVASVSRVEAT